MPRTAIAMVTARAPNWSVRIVLTIWKAWYDRGEELTEMPVTKSRCVVSFACFATTLDSITCNRPGIAR